MVPGVIYIDVNEQSNTGVVRAEFQDGEERLYVHGDSGNRDPSFPKTWLYLGGWGTGNVWKKEVVLYKDYDAHFMVMERLPDRKTHEVHYPVKPTLPGSMEVDLRSKEQNHKNSPPF